MKRAVFTSLLGLAMLFIAGCDSGSSGDGDNTDGDQSVVDGDSGEDLEWPDMDGDQAAVDGDMEAEEDVSDGDKDSAADGDVEPDSDTELDEDTETDGDLEPDGDQEPDGDLDAEEEGITCDGCLIDDICIPSGQEHPESSCGYCNPEENATGWTARIQGTECREAVSDCDLTEVCNGINLECPADGFAEADTQCGDGPTECSGQDTCDGAGICQPNHFGTDHTCGDDGTDCVNQDLCDGEGGCTDNGFKTDGVVCGDDDLDQCVSGQCLDCYDADGCGDLPWGDRSEECSERVCGDGHVCAFNDTFPGTECNSDDQCDGSGLCVDCVDVAGCADYSEDENPCTDLACVTYTCADTNDNENTCDLGHDCTDDHCVDGSCLVETVTIGCLIEDACVAEGASQDTDGCVACDPDTDDRAWTNMDGAACAVTDDDNPCTDDICDGGSCTVINDDTNTCSDDIGCTDTVCSGGDCIVSGTNAGCYIGEACYDEGATEAATGDGSCQVCEAATDWDAWTTKESGGCDDADACTHTDSCGTGGVCEGTLFTCGEHSSCDGQGNCPCDLDYQDNDDNGSCEMACSHPDACGNYACDDSSGMAVCECEFSEPELISNIGGRAEDVHIEGGYAFVAQTGGGLYIYGISNPSAPVLVGKSDIPRWALGIYVVDQIAYVADAFSGLQIFDVSNVNSPVLLGGYETEGRALDVKVVNDLAYVSDDESNLLILDIANPSEPVLLGNYDTPFYAKSIFIENQVAYITGHTGLQIIDVSQSDNPILLGSYSSSKLIYDVFIVGQNAFIANSDFGLRILDVSDPSEITSISNIDTPNSRATAVVVVGNLAYLADGNEGFQIIDVSNLSEPAMLSQTDTPGYAKRLALRENTLVVADSANGIQLFDISQPVSPGFLGHYEAPVDAFGIFVKDNMAFVTDYQKGLKIIDVSVPSSPKYLGSYNTPGNALGIYVVDQTAYIADDDTGLSIVDVSNPEAPALLGNYTTPGKAYDITVLDQIAYVVEYSGGVQIISVADPSSPEFLGSYATSDGVYGIVVTDNIAYITAETDGLIIVDVSDPRSPELISADLPGDAYSVYIENQTAYVGLSGGLQVVDVSNLSDPITLGSQGICSYAQKVTVKNQRAYLACMDGLHVVDVSDPSVMTVLGAYSTEDTTNVFVNDQTAFVTDNGSGLFIVDIATCTCLEGYGGPNCDPVPTISDLAIDLSSTTVCFAGGYTYPVSFGSTNATSWSATADDTNTGSWPGTLSPSSGAISSSTTTLDYITDGGSGIILLTVEVTGPGGTASDSIEFTCY